MIICPDFNNKEVAEEFNELTRVLGEKAAYHVWSKNNGYPLDKAPDGTNSKLFDELLNTYNNRPEAIRAKAKYYTKDYLSKDDWLKEFEGSTPQVSETPSQQVKPAIEEPDPTVFEFPKTKEEEKTTTNRFSPVADKLRLDIKGLNQKRDLILRKAKATDDIGKKNDLYTQAHKLAVKIEGKEEDITSIEKVEAIKDIGEYAKSDFEEIERLMEVNRGDIANGKKVEEAANNSTFEDLEYILNKVKFWSKLGEVNRDSHYIFTPDELAEEELMKPFEEWKERSDRTAEFIAKVQRTKLVEWVQEVFPNYEFDNADDLFNFTKDIGKVESEVLDISQINNVVIKAMYKANAAANRRAYRDLINEMDEFEPIWNEGEKEGKRLYGRGWKNMLKQKDKNGVENGRIVMPIAQDFWDDRRRVKDKYWKKTTKFLEWRHENEIILDPRIMFPDKEVYDREEFTEADRKALEKKLISVMGEDQYNLMVEDAEEIIDKFKQTREKIISDLKEELGDDYLNALNEWDSNNNPYYLAESISEQRLINNTYADSKLAQGALRFVPSKDKYIDKNYEKIAKNDKLRALHTKMVDIITRMNNFMPNDMKKELQVNTIPVLERGMLEAFSTPGAQLSFKGFFNYMNDTRKKSIREEGLGKGLNVLRDIEGNEHRRLDPKIGKTIKSIVEADLQLEIVKYENKYKDSPSEQWKELTRRKIESDVSKSMSWDLKNVLRYYIMTAHTYKHKAQYEDTMKAAYNIIQDAKGNLTNHANIQITKENKEPYKTDDLKNIKSSLEYFYNTAFLGERGKVPEAVDKKRVYTKEEQELKKELEDEIEGLKKREKILADDIKEHPTADNSEVRTELDRIIKQKTDLQQRLDNLGGVRSFGKMADNVLKYYQLKVMGWNIKAGIANLGFALISNAIMAADGRAYDSKGLWNAYGMVIRNMGRSKKNSPLKQKVANFITKLDVSKDATQEIFFNRLSSPVTDKLKGLAPHEITKRAEFMNHGVVAIAIAKTMEFNGKPLWDYIDEKGNFSKEVTEDTIDELAFKIYQVNMINHGNYDTLNAPVRMKNNFFGRALLQFRSWAIMGFQSRFKKEDPEVNPLLGFKRKGRYRTLWDQFTKLKDEQGENIGRMDILRANLEYFVSKLTFSKVGNKGAFEKAGFTEVDAANMRGNLTELYIYTWMMAMGYMITMLSYGDDDEDKPTGWDYAYANFTMNMLSRVESDILYYISPMEMEKLQKNPLAVAGVVEDLFDVGEGIRRLYNGNDKLQSGRDKGKSYIWRETTDFVPFWTQVQRVRSSAYEVYDF